MQAARGLGKLASRTTAAGAAGAAAQAVCAPSAGAYALPMEPLLAGGRERAALGPHDIVDDWINLDPKGDTLVFPSAAIDAAASSLQRAAVTQGPVVTELSACNAKSVTTDGCEADAIIEADDLDLAAAGGGLGGAGIGAAGPAILIAQKMLKRPGLQREVVLAILEDDEVLAILEREMGRDNLEWYLAQGGFAAQGLLGPGTGAAAAAAARPLSAELAVGADGRVRLRLAVVAEAAWQHEDAAERSALEAQRRRYQRITPERSLELAPRRARQAEAAAMDPFLFPAMKLAEGLEAAGEKLASLGGWMRARLLPGANEACDGEEGEGGPRGPPSGLDRAVGGLMVAMVAIVVVAVLRQPALLARMVRFAARAL